MKMNEKKAEVTEKMLTGEVEEDELSQFEIVDWLLNDKDIDAEIKRKLIDKILAQAKCAGLSAHEYATISEWCVKKLLTIFLDTHVLKKMITTTQKTTQTD
jgi:hypothetical protein